MGHLDLGALARAIEAQTPGGGLPEEVQAVGTDTRSLPSGSLFVALRGERFDAHAFLDQAKDAGAIAAVVDHDIAGAPMPLLVVEDTLVALGRIGTHVRHQNPVPVVGITGSNGKTTTKELIASALSACGAVHKTQGNLNNRIGVPLTLLARDENAWVSVVEMGMNEPEEIGDLTQIAQPTVGVITLIGPAHIEKLGSIESIAKAKGELYRELPAESTAVVNVDDPLIMDISVRFLSGQRRVTFGRDSSADVRVVEARAHDGGVMLTLEVQGAKRETRLPFPGLHNALNAAAAIAVALALGVDTDAAIDALQATELPGSRLVVRRDLGIGVSVLDDSYNANPQSVAAGFETLRDLASGRKIAVLGDMLELGDQAQALHHETGRAAGQSGVEWVLALGAFASDLAEGARATGARGDAFDTMDDLLAALDRELTAGDWLLVKGSRGMKMERVVTHLSGEGA